MPEWYEEWTGSGKIRMVEMDVGERYSVFLSLSCILEYCTFRRFLLVPQMNSWPIFVYANESFKNFCFFFFFLEEKVFLLFCKHWCSFFYFETESHSVALARVSAVALA